MILSSSWACPTHFLPDKMAFLEDPRLRQRWNEISHNAGEVTENAAASLWTFQHTYINPCLASVAESLDTCTAVCLGDREERARRARERERGAYGGRAEYSFDFYDDWDDDDEAMAGFFGSAGTVGITNGVSGGGVGGASSGGLFGSWAAGTRDEDWDRLIGGSGSARIRHGAGGGDVVDQPRRKGGMSYGTRGARRKTAEEEDPTIIPSTAPLGFLGKLPWKIGGPLRYKPSAANLRDHPGASMHMADENAPLLGPDDGGGGGGGDLLHLAYTPSITRKRSGTASSGDTSDSYRSRGDLFPSDGEGDEDAVPLDDEFTVALARVDDRSSNKTRSSKGKRPEGKGMARSVSHTTVSSTQTTRPSLRPRGGSSTSIPRLDDLGDLEMQEELAEQEEDAEVERKRAKAAELAMKRGLSKDDLVAQSVAEVKSEMVQVDDIPEPPGPEHEDADVTKQNGVLEQEETAATLRAKPPPLPPSKSSTDGADDQFIPARLPHFR